MILFILLFSYLDFNAYFFDALTQDITRFNSCGCKISKVVIQKISDLFKSSCVAFPGLLVFAILSVNVNFGCLLNLFVLGKWQHAWIAFLSNTSDLWLFRLKLNGVSHFLIYLIYIKYTPDQKLALTSKSLQVSLFL